MKQSRILFLSALLLTGVLVGQAPARAQTANDMSVLSEQERQDFADRFAGSHMSSDRAKIKSELIRLIQKRKLEQRTNHRDETAEAPTETPAPAPAKAIDHEN